MERKKSIHERKLFLAKKLEVIFKRGQLSECKFNYVCECLKLHAIKTNWTGDRGITAGQFVSLDSHFWKGEELYLCVGVGRGCLEDSQEDFLWFLGENKCGIKNFKVKTYAELVKYLDKYQVKMKKLNKLHQ